MDTNPFPAPHRRRRRNRGLRPEAVITALIVVFVLVAGVATPFVTSFAGEQTRTCTVTRTDRTRSESGSDMRIYTADCGTLTVDDIMLRGQFDAADIYAEFEAGQAYEITTVGFRVPFLSLFPRVLGAPSEVAP